MRLNLVRYFKPNSGIIKVDQQPKLLIVFEVFQKAVSNSLTCLLYLSSEYSLYNFGPTFIIESLKVNGFVHFAILILILFRDDSLIPDMH